MNVSEFILTFLPYSTLLTLALIHVLSVFLAPHTRYKVSLILCTPSLSHPNCWTSKAHFMAASKLE